jgi:hypothetical protein
MKRTWFERLVRFLVANSGTNHQAWQAGIIQAAHEGLIERHKNVQKAQRRWEEKRQ